MIEELKSENTIPIVFGIEIRRTSGEIGWAIYHKQRKDQVSWQES
jgi:hypothetical protein